MAIFTTLIDVMEQIGSQYVHHHEKLDWTTKTMPQYDSHSMISKSCLRHANILRISGHKEGWYESIFSSLKFIVGKEKTRWQKRKRYPKTTGNLNRQQNQNRWVGSIGLLSKKINIPTTYRAAICYERRWWITYAAWHWQFQTSRTRISKRINRSN